MGDAESERNERRFKSILRAIYVLIAICGVILLLILAPIIIAFLSGLLGIRT